MFSLFPRLFFAALVYLAITCVGSADDQKAALLTCFDTKISQLISSKSRDYSSRQFRIVCQYRDTDKREKNETFVYTPPEGFRIVSADAEVVLQSSRTSINDLKFQGQHATINLQCKGRPEDELVHDAVAVKIVGRLEYLPGVQETRGIVGNCLDEISLR